MKKNLFYGSVQIVARRAVVAVLLLSSCTVHAGWFGPSEKDIRDAVLAGRCVGGNFYRDNHNIEASSIVAKKYGNDSVWMISYVVDDRTICCEVLPKKCKKESGYWLHIIRYDVDKNFRHKRNDFNNASAPMQPLCLIDDEDRLSCIRTALATFCGFKFGQLFDPQIPKEGHYYFNLRRPYRYFTKGSIAKTGDIGSEVLCGVILYATLPDEATNEIQVVVSDMQKKYGVKFTTENGYKHMYKTPDGDISIVIEQLNKKLELTVLNYPNRVLNSATVL